ncbi:MAG: tRNA dihydrouridine synthase [Chloroflexota bacterium]
MWNAVCRGAAFLFPGLGWGNIQSGALPRRIPDAVQYPLLRWMHHHVTLPLVNTLKAFPELRSGHPAVILAPMQGVTDRSMRELMGEWGGFTFCVSEYVRVSEHVLPRKVFYAQIPEVLNPECVTPSGLPVSVQLLGGDPERMALTAAVAAEAGARSIDINFGCPAPTVNRHDGGASLLRYPARIRDIVAAVRQAVPAHIPVSAKLRLGWDSRDPIHENAEMAAQGGASWITIHARTRVQGYAPPVFWEAIGAVNRELPIPVVANGDIWTIDDLRRCQDETACEHFMLGRGALADPWLPHRIAAELGIATPRELQLANGPTEHTLPEWLPLLRRFTEIGFRAYAGQYTPSAVSRYTAMRIKQWLRVASARHPSPWLALIKLAQSTEDVLDILEQSCATELQGRRSFASVGTP